MTGHRSEQLGSVIHRAVQTILSRGLSDPRLEAMITVTTVKVTQDRLTAVVHVSVLPEQHESRVIHALRNASRHIRRLAGDMVDIHRMPELAFKIDHSAKREAELLDAMARVRAEREANAPTPSTPDQPKPDTTDHDQA